VVEREVSAMRHHMYVPCTTEHVRFERMELYDGGGCWRICLLFLRGLINDTVGFMFCIYLSAGTWYRICVANPCSDWWRFLDIQIGLRNRGLAPLAPINRPKPTFRSKSLSSDDRRPGSDGQNANENRRYEQFEVEKRDHDWQPPTSTKDSPS
jgi:hypothetical protein